MLKGERIGIVPMQQKDDWIMFKWFNDPAVRESVGRQEWKACVNLDEVEMLVRQRLQDPGVFPFLAFTVEDDGPLAYIEINHLHKMRDDAGLFIVWGERFDADMAKEAVALALSYGFNAFNLHRLWTKIPSRNMEMTEVLQELGFKIEGVLREDHFHKGRYHDSLLLSILSFQGAGPC